MFREALIDILRRLDQSKQDKLLRNYALIGGVAVSAWGVPRATHDIDFVLALGPSDPVKLSTRLGGKYVAGALDDPLRGVFNLSVAAGHTTVPIQLILLPSHWTDVVFDQAQVLSILGCSVPVVSWQTLILLKLYAGGPQDLLDARELLSVQQPGPESIRDMRRLAAAINLTDELAALLNLDST
ncbi:MAG TPA: hypothetical protein VJ692_06835 [Nitrospiraceae bacterium]|nr:hypothetical protein [Nitrospiraceae bacterium]